jgi:hypothetical protein
MIIAMRLLKLREGGRDIEVPVRFYKPKKEDGDWSCRLEIDWPDEQEAMSMHGYDAVQAMVLAFQMVGSRLYASEEHKAGKLYLVVPGRGYGFPVIRSERDQLIGDDKEFF